MKKLHYVYLKPQHYYAHLFFFFVLAALILSFRIVYHYRKFDASIFLINFVVILFLLLLIAAFAEFFWRGEYMNPLEVYDVEKFFNAFMRYVYSDRVEEVDTFFNKYDSKSKAKFEKVFSKNKKFLLSSIRKQGKIYEIVFIDQTRIMTYFLIRFLSKRAIHKMQVREVKGDLKIVWVS